jgi:MOSC domain-containing protein YiiM
MNAKAHVVSLHIAPSGAAPMQSVGSVNAIVGRGLEGDRYCNHCGTYSNHPGDGRHVTLIESEAIAALQREYQIALVPGLARRNIVTRGVALNHLIAREFCVGEVILRGMRLCEPCLHLEKLSGKGAMRGLIHRGGLRAEIINGGIIRVGDPIVAAPPGAFSLPAERSVCSE